MFVHAESLSYVLQRKEEKNTPRRGLRHQHNHSMDHVGVDDQLCFHEDGRFDNDRAGHDDLYGASDGNHYGYICKHGCGECNGNGYLVCDDEHNHIRAHHRSIHLHDVFQLSGHCNQQHNHLYHGHFNCDLDLLHVLSVHDHRIYDVNRCVDRD